MAGTVRNWESLRSLGSQIKAHTLSNLGQYLEQFEKNALQNGVKVHWAADAREHNRIVCEILKQHKVGKLVKSKSMLTEECGLNPYLEAQGIEVTDTDLGERIVQLAKEHPSHIVMPAIHKKREEIDLLFQEHLGTRRSGGDALYLTREARKHLRQRFLQADAALTGVNFAIAETGGFVVCTNEGNADMGVHATPLHIACMGIEKIIPAQEHLGVFLRLLARSATGQPITTYSSHFRAPAPGQEIHIVIVDNGRSNQLGRPEFRNSLHCIRCGACINTCPVYRRSGGHSYGYTIPGPIGSILAPGKDLHRHASLPFASTLCGSCHDVCPVKIDIHKQLFRWRQVIVREEGADFFKTLAMKATAFVFARPGLFAFGGKVGRLLLKITPRFLVYSRLNSWGKQRELPAPPGQSFTEWYKRERG
ncbi:MAG: lactate utilization protein [Calditrichaeota bacterium]|nr:lactate utilization protein [Calditrichota bacterium]